MSIILRLSLFVLTAVGLDAQAATLTYIDQKNGFQNGRFGTQDWLVTSAPVLGSTVAVRMPVSYYDSGCNCQSTFVLGIGRSNPQLKLVTGYLYTTVDWSRTAGVGEKGGWLYPRFGVPNNRSLIGTGCNMQVVEIRSNSNGAWLGQFSRGARLVIGT